MALDWRHIRAVTLCPLQTLDIRKVAGGLPVNPNGNSHFQLRLLSLTLDIPYIPNLNFHFPLYDTIPYALSPDETIVAMGSGQSHLIGTSGDCDSIEDIFGDKFFLPIGGCISVICYLYIFYLYFVKKPAALMRHPTSKLLYYLL